MEILGARSGTSIQYTPAPYASCTCPQDGCGYPSKDNRHGDEFLCGACGHADDADRVGALSALKRGGDSKFPRRKEEILNYLLKAYEQKSRNRLGNLGCAATKEAAGTKGTASVMTTPDTAPRGEGEVERENLQSRGDPSGDPGSSPPAEKQTVK
jgi:hypothetical protein